MALGSFAFKVWPDNWGSLKDTAAATSMCSPPWLHGGQDEKAAHMGQSSRPSGFLVPAVICLTANNFYPPLPSIPSFCCTQKQVEHSRHSLWSIPCVRQVFPISRVAKPKAQTNRGCNDIPSRDDEIDVCTAGASRWSWGEAEAPAGCSGEGPWPPLLWGPASAAQGAQNLPTGSAGQTQGKHRAKLSLETEPPCRCKAPQNTYSWERQQSLSIQKENWFLRLFFPPEVAYTSLVLEYLQITFIFKQWHKWDCEVILATIK